MTDELRISTGLDYPEIRDSVSKVCAAFPGAYWRKLEEDLAYPTEFVTALTEAGYLSALIPEQYGGSGMPLRAAAVILETIHASGCNAGACHAQMYTMGTVLRHGSETQKQKYLPQIASGALRLQAFGVTEPTTGTDTTKLKTRAVRDGDSYVINGQKVWTSRALHSDLMLLLARTTPQEEVKKKSEGLSVFLIDIRSSLGHGMQIQPLKAMVNHHATEVFFDNLRIPADTLIGDEGKGLKYILDGMNAERILVSSEAIGDARWFTKTSVAYVNGRRVFDRPIGQNQGVQFPIARDMRKLKRPIWCCAARLRASPLVCLAATTPTWANCSPRTQHGTQPKPACKATAASALHASTMSNASGARRGCSRLRRSRPIWCSRISANIFSACRARFERAAVSRRR